MTITDILAIIGAVTGIIGAITGTTAIVWDVYKFWYSEQVRLKVTAIPGFLSTANPNERLISVSVTNIGKIPTTIKLLSFQGFNTKPSSKIRYGEKTSVMMTPLHGQLPVRLNPGDDWFCAFSENAEGMDEFYSFKHFFIQVEDTMSTKPFRAEVDKSLVKSLKK